jgi:hypothetical protein
MGHCIPEGASRIQQSFKDRNALAVVEPPKGAKVLGTTTRLDYKINNSVFENTKSVCAYEGTNREKI